MRYLSARLAFAGLFAGLAAFGGARLAAQDFAPSEEVATYFNKRFGFTISYPTAYFSPQEPLREDGRVWASPDGRAKLLAGAFGNDEGLSLIAYRAFLMKESYGNAEIDYAPVRDGWFVLSGTRDGTMFYERVTFSCGGKRINSWAMLYPATEREVYDRIIEKIARTYRPGARNCE
jgi:hypothetical protein